MNTWAGRILFWSPRILGIGFTLFLSIFALDVFGEDRDFWGTAVALLIHLTPVYIVVIMLVIAWRREWVGAILFPALAVFYLVFSWGRFHWSAYLVISGPLFLVGALFWANCKFRGKLGASG
jgi:hypothetical protein